MTLGWADTMVVIIMGAAGAGKSTVGRALAAELGWSFRDADDLHLPSSVAKMRQGHALTDEERRPWLNRVRSVIDAALASGAHTVIACSALRENYRQYLIDGRPDVRLVFLRAAPALLEHRLVQRTGHFASPRLLQSQLETLEPPSNAISVDASFPVETLVRQIRERLRS